MMKLWIYENDIIYVIADLYATFAVVKKIQACMEFEPSTSVIPVQHSYKPELIFFQAFFSQLQKLSI